MTPVSATIGILTCTHAVIVTIRFSRPKKRTSTTPWCKWLQERRAAPAMKAAPHLTSRVTAINVTNQQLPLPLTSKKPVPPSSAIKAMPICISAAIAITVSLPPGNCPNASAWLTWKKVSPVEPVMTAQMLLASNQAVLNVTLSEK